MTGTDVDRALAKLDLDTKARLLAGQNMWTLPGIEGIGLASLVMSDGPIGVRGRSFSLEDPAIALPSPTALAATWDRSLAGRAGELLAQEARRKGVHVLLAPTVNLHRSPLGGRHFECYSEDPLLTGEIAAGYVAGVQRGGVAATVKHFVANDSETDRMTVNVLADERTLRELYLLPFEIVVRDAAPAAVMAAYNSVNGSTMTEHDFLVNSVLRGEWGFDGVVVSDWLAARDTVGAALGGLDIAMPGPRTVFGSALADAVRAGRVPEHVVDEKVRRVLRLADRTGALGDAPAVTADPVDGPAFARELAARSFVLLRNENALPLARDTKIALIGAAARRARALGGGSAEVFPEHIVSPLEGLRAAGADVRYAKGPEPTARVAPAREGFALRAICRGDDGEVLRELALPEGSVRWVGDLPEGLDLAELRSVEITGTFVPPDSGTHTFAVDGAGRFRFRVADEVLFDGEQELGPDPFRALFDSPQHLVEVPLSEGEPVEVSLEYTLRRAADMPLPFLAFGLGHAEPSAPADQLIEDAVAAAAEAGVAVVVVGTTREVESEGFDRTTLSLPGRQDELIARVAAANPRTIVVVNAGSPVEMPWRDDVAAILLAWFPGQEAGHALADVLLGEAEPGGRLPTTWPATLADAPISSTTPRNGELRYDEGVFIGYRAWERQGKEPAFGFGHGLGYTTWEYESARVDGETLTVRVRNTGDRAGREVVQAYLGPAVADPDRPARWLAGFAVVEADPGATAEATITLPRRAFEVWDGEWRLVTGNYLVHSGRSWADSRLVTELTVG